MHDSVGPHDVSGDGSRASCVRRRGTCCQGQDSWSSVDRPGEEVPMILMHRGTSREGATGTGETAFRTPAGHGDGDAVAQALQAAGRLSEGLFCRHTSGAD